MPLVVTVKRIGDQATFQLSPKRAEQALRRAVNQVARPALIKMHQEVIEGKRQSVDGKAWKHKVAFRGRFRIRGGDALLYIYPTGPNKQLWTWTSKGTRPHKIKAKKGKVLSFMWGGPGVPSPKTVPRGGMVVGGGIASPVAFTEVDHPGTKPRKFEEDIAKEYQPKFRRLIRKTIRDFVS